MVPTQTPEAPYFQLVATKMVFHLKVLWLLPEGNNQSNYEFYLQYHELLVLTTVFATGFNQKLPPAPTITLAIDMGKVLDIDK